MMLAKTDRTMTTASQNRMPSSVLFRNVDFGIHTHEVMQHRALVLQHQRDRLADVDSNVSRLKLEFAQGKRDRLGGGVMIFIAWLMAMILRAMARGFLEATNMDKHIGEAADLRIGRWHAPWARWSTGWCGCCSCRLSLRPLG